MENNNVLVSILVITYNHEKYIEETLESLLKQKVTFEYEILVGEDCSTDNTGTILISKYKNNPKVRLFTRKKNIGGTKNAYNLVMHARGKYLFMYEGDDYLTDDFALQYMVDWIENHNEYIGISCRRIALSEKTGRKRNRKIDADCNSDISLDDFVNRKAEFDPCATLFLNFYHDNKYDYRWYKISRHVGDITTAIYMLLHGKIYQSDRIIGVYRLDRVKGASCYNNIVTERAKWREYLEISVCIEKKLSINLDKMKSEYAYGYINCISGFFKIKEAISLIGFIGIKAWKSMIINMIQKYFELLQEGKNE
jgi:glycosyltransferase, family 2